MKRRIYSITDKVCTDKASIEKTLKDLKERYDLSDDHIKVLRFMIEYGEASFEEIQICTGIEPRKLRRILGP